MTLEENKIISFHRNLALWCAVNSQAFNFFFQSSSSPQCGIDYACRQFYLNNLDEMVDSTGKEFDEDYGEEYYKARLSDYCFFCKDLLVEKRFFPIKERNKANEKSEEWLDFFEETLIDKGQLLYFFLKHNPLIIINRWTQTIDRDMVLSYCDEFKKQKVLLNALVSLLYNAILNENDLGKKIRCCKLLRDALIDKKEKIYSVSSGLCTALKCLKSNVCESFFKGFGLSIEDYDSLLSYIGTGNDSIVIDEIANLRNNNHLVNDSRLIEFCVDFQQAQAQDRFIDWSKRFTLKNDIHPINALLLKRIQDEKLISQDVINSILYSICLGIDFDTVKLPKKDKKDKGVAKRYISFSMKHVDKEKFINMLIEKEWVAVESNRDEVILRLNYFFNDSSSVSPSDPNFTVAWNKNPKNQLVCLLIRMLLTRKWDFEAKDVVVRYVDEENGKRQHPGINSKVIDPIDIGESVWKTVSAVFKVSHAEIGTFNSKNYKNPEKHLNKLVELAGDILSCKRLDN